VSRILFDVNVPRPLGRLLTGHDIELADHIGWREMTNGELLSAAEQAGFDLMLTADSNLRYQQNLSGRRISIIALSTNAWPIIRNHVERITAAIDAATPGSYAEISLPRPKPKHTSP